MAVISGNGIINGTPDDDTISGGAGNDTIQASEGGNDILYGGEGNDFLITYGVSHLNGYVVPPGNTMMDGGAGNDTINTSGGGNDALYGGDGNDYLSASGVFYMNGNSNNYLPSGNNILDGGAGNDSIYSSGGNNDSLYGGDGNDMLWGESYARWDGNSYYIFSLANTLLNGVGGNDTILVSSGINDSLIGGLGNDYISMSTSVTYGSGNNFLYLPAGNNYVDGGPGDDTIQISAGNNDSIYGGDGNDVIMLTNSWTGNGNGSYYNFLPAGNTYMDGGAGNDTLQGADGNDVLCGAGGNDLLSGMAGADEYFFSGVFGQDTIMADSTNAQDRINFQGFSHDQISAARVGNDLLLTLDAGNTVTIRSWRNSLEQFSFSDGYYVLDDGLTWRLDEAFLREGGDGNDSLTGGFGNDTLRGGKGSDTLVGLGRNDLLTGGAGNDCYLFGFAAPSNGVWTLGYFGSDTITANPANANDWIVVDNIEGNTPYRSGNDLVLTVWNNVSSNAGTITLQDWLITDPANRIHHLTMRDGYRYFGNGNDGINYYFDVDTTANGTIFDFAGNRQNQMVYGLEGNDTLLGGDGKDWLSGDAGNDSLNGDNGDDNLYGGGGNDFLAGGAGNDMLRGGQGNDTLSGGAGVDVYRYGSGSTVNGEIFGNDVILADSNNANDILYVRNTDGLPLAAKVGNDLKLTYAVGSITLQEWYTGGAENRITNIKVNESATNTTYIARLDAGDDGDNAIEAMGDAANVMLYGLGGNDTLTGSSGDDCLTGGAGNDFLTGGAGNDTYSYGFAIPGNGTMIMPGFGNDTIAAGSGNDVLIVDNIDAANPVQVGNDLILSVWDNGVNGSAGTITLQNWLTQADADRIHNLVMRDGYRYYGSGNNPISYYFDIDTTGSGTLRDYSGNSANQIYYGEGGNDTIIGGAGKDWLAGDADNDSVSGGTGDDQLYGNIGDDWLAGGDGNDVLRGGSGSDTLAGGTGNDIYRFGYGANGGNIIYNAEVNGNDVIVSDPSNGNDILLFRNTDLPDNAALVGDDLVIGYWNYADDKDYTLTLQDWALGGGYRITQYQQNYVTDPAGYSENNRYTLGGGTNGADSADFSGNYNMRFYFAFDGNDTYHGGEAMDRVLGGNGADQIYGGYGSDWLKGQSGDDMLYGEADNDMLQGGAGNDWLSGGNGVDTFRFGSGDETTLQENFGNDTIAGAADNFEDILLLRNLEGLQGGQQSGNDLRLDFINVDRGGILNSITMQDWFRGPEYRLQTVAVMNGDSNQGNTTSTFLLQVGSNDSSSVNFAGANAVLYFGMDGNDTVYGGTGADVMFGGAGNDLLVSGTTVDDSFLGQFHQLMAAAGLY